MPGTRHESYAAGTHTRREFKCGTYAIGSYSFVPYLLRKVPRDQGPDEGGLAHLLCKKKGLFVSTRRGATRKVGSQKRASRRFTTQQKREQSARDREQRERDLEKRGTRRQPAGKGCWAQKRSRESARLSPSVILVSVPGLALAVWVRRAYRAYPASRVPLVRTCMRWVHQVAVRAMM